MTPSTPSTVPDTIAAVRTMPWLDLVLLRAELNLERHEVSSLLLADHAMRGLMTKTTGRNSIRKESSQWSKSQDSRLGCEKSIAVATLLSKSTKKTHSQAKPQRQTTAFVVLKVEDETRCFLLHCQCPGDIDRTLINFILRT